MLRGQGLAGLFRFRPDTRQDDGDDDEEDDGEDEGDVDNDEDEENVSASVCMCVCLCLWMYVFYKPRQYYIEIFPFFIIRDCFLRPPPNVEEPKVPTSLFSNWPPT